MATYDDSTVLAKGRQPNVVARARMLCLLIIVAFVSGVATPCLPAQAPPKSGTQEALPEPRQLSYNPLPDLPRPPDEPASLHEPATAPARHASVLDEPCFGGHASLDPCPQNPLGWFADMQLAVVVPHVKNKLINTVTLPGGQTTSVALPAADLDWTVSPYLSVGYRLPSGFGEVTLDYRFLGSEGTDTLAGEAARPTFLKSRFDLHQADLDYASWEFMSCFDWTMKWRIGGRLASIYFDSRATTAGIPGGAGASTRQDSNWFIGFGPHVGLDLVRHFENSGFQFIGRGDFATTFGRIHQKFRESDSSAAPDGSALAGETRVSSSQAVPSIRTQVGLGWQPPQSPGTLFFLGYQYEYWWNAGRLSKTDSRGEVEGQGIVLQAQMSF